MALCGGDNCRCRLTRSELEARPGRLELREGQEVCTTLGCGHPFGWHPTAAAGVTATVAAKDEAAEREHLLQALSPEHKRRVEALYEYATKKLRGEQRPTKNWSISRFEWEEVQKAFITSARTPPLHLPSSKFLEMDALMVDIKRRCRKYFTSIMPFRDEAAVESFVEPVLLHIADCHPDIVVERQPLLRATFFPADGRADFVLKSLKGKFYVCVVEAKKDDMTGGRAQNYVEAEMCLEMTKQQKVYGIVTNFNQWIFVEVSDSAVAEVQVSVDFDDEGCPRLQQLQFVCDTIWAMCENMMKES